ncbi:MAG TPA: type II secretion system protein [Jatrophihabitans sp.]|jgi:prepilin-type N-terminal cleavage/methylation domain-containing protein|uniref:type II secretion system protein n=1 Tax=Jatrophihabitans sp. TaxID=1932789 RepID=UPI002DFB00F9|nr:type II secretion system protein [Jatrophihabitans sp.]
MSGKRSTANDSGFTLVEILLSVVIIGVITVPLGNLLISYFTTTGVTSGRVSESHDEQQLATFFAQDVSNVGTRSLTSPYTAAQSIWTSGFPSGACGAGTTGSELLLLKSDDITWASVSQTASRTVNLAAYYVRTVGSETQLHRVACSDSGGGASPRTDDVLAYNINPSAANSVACTPDCTTNPTSVTMTLSIAAAGRGQPYTLVVSGRRRQT